MMVSHELVGAISYLLVCQIPHSRNLFKKISYPAKKLTRSAKYASLTRNKLQRFQTETCYHSFLEYSDTLRNNNSKASISCQPQVSEVKKHDSHKCTEELPVGKDIKGR